VFLELATEQVTNQLKNLEIVTAFNGVFVVGLLLF
jgi:hypothetical protein